MIQLPEDLINKILSYVPTDKDMSSPVAELFHEVFDGDLDMYADGAVPSGYSLWASCVLNHGYYCYCDKGTWHHWKSKRLPWYKNY